jgi:hypothetical protein
MAGDAPDGAAAVLATIETQRKAVNEWSEREFERLDRAAIALGGTTPRHRVQESSAKSKPRRRRHQAAVTSPAAALERSEKVCAYILAAEEPVVPAVARKDLDMSEVQFRTAANRLIKDGRIERSGDRQFTRYHPVGQAPPAAAAPPPPPAVSTPPPPSTEGTDQGRILARILGDGFATRAGLAQFTGMDEDQVRSVCGNLIAEEEIEMERREGVTVYVPAAGVA